MSDLAETYLNKFKQRIGKPKELLNFIEELSVEDSITILKELNTTPENYPEIVHEASSFLTTMLILKHNGIPIVKKSLLQRLFKR